MHPRTRLALAGIAACTLAAGATPALAAGYDTPILYTARHMGMGGVAISYVRDGSALFHNPAGLGRISCGNLIGDVSVLLGSIKASPDSPGQNLRSDTTFAPFFLVGGAGRVTDWLSLGMAIYPVASAGATYEYTNKAGLETLDETTLLFFEASPGFAVNLLDDRLMIGAGYRIQMVSLERIKGDPDNPRGFDLDLSGFQFAAFRVGVQYQILDELSAGLVFRSRAKTEVSADEAVFLTDLGETKTDFIHPAQLGFGLRLDLGRFGVGTDVQYTFNSQVQDQTFVAENATNPSAPPLEIPNIARWQDNWTVRLGGEYRLPVASTGQLALRLGYLLDTRASNPSYPTAFGTPPTETHSVTAGVGYDGGPWELNFAYAYRMGSTTVDPDPNSVQCVACSQPGDYAINLNGIYVDFSWDFEKCKDEPAPVAMAPADSDGDGIVDGEDGCPSEPEDPDGYQDLDGCPDPDNDGDGVADADDRCPAAAEDPDGFQDGDGCPDPDNDGDGIADADDQCPMEAEVLNGVDDTDGCPDESLAKVEGGKIVILDKVYFDVGRTTIKKVSFPVLDAVVGVLKANPSIARVRIEGHTDDQGAASSNLKLSDGRAKAVRDYLVAAGIDAGRLDPVGYGEDRPAMEGKTKEAREANRRVEFVIMGE